MKVDPRKINEFDKAVVKEKTGKSRYVFSTENLARYQFPTHINDLVIDRIDSDYSEVFMVVILPGNAPLLHKHDDTEQIFYVIQGSGVLTIGDHHEQFNVKPGDFVRIPVSTLHSIKANSKEILKYFCVDCFGGKPVNEPSWDDHVKVVCAGNNWDFEQVAGRK